MALFQRFKTRYVESAPQWEELPPPGPRSVGDLLRQRRESLGLRLDEAAAALRIKQSYLLALEEGEPDRLPGPAYAIGFLRAYGDHLGLDSQEVLRRFKAVSSVLDSKPDLSFPMPLGEGSIPGGAMLLVAVILALCGYGTWYYLSTAERSRPERVAAVPAALLPPPAPSRSIVPPSGGAVVSYRPPPPAPQSTAAAAPAGGGAEGPAGGSPAPEKAPAASLTAVSPPVEKAAVPPGNLVPGLVVPAALPAPAATPQGTAAPAAASSSAAPSAAPGATAGTTAGTAAGPAAGAAAEREPPHAYGAAGKPAHVVIIATADSWVQVREPDGSPLFSRVLKPGESYRVPERAGLTLQTGNAGGLEITVDGKAIPPIGKSGAIRRGVNLDPQALASGAVAQQ